MTTEVTIPESTTPPATPVVTPPVAPVTAPASPAALNIDLPAVPAPSNEQFEYTPTGDAGLDVALDFVGAQGFGPAHPAIVAAQGGDFTVLEAALKERGDKAKGYERIIALAKQSFESGKNKRAETEASTRKVVHEAAGGEANWVAIQAWAAANADPAERTQINAALAAGGLTAQFAVQGLAALYAKSPKTNPPASAVKAGAGAAPAATGQLTSREYASEVQKLRNTLGTKLESSVEYKTLVSRRSAARAAGIK